MLTTDSALGMSIVVGGANEYSNGRIIRLCMHSGMDAITAPVRRLGTFRGILIGSNRDRYIRLSLPVTRLTLCGTGVRRIMRPKSFRVRVKTTSSSVHFGGAVAVGEGWAYLFFIVSFLVAEERAV